MYIFVVSSGFDILLSQY